MLLVILFNCKVAAPVSDPCGMVIGVWENRESKGVRVVFYKTDGYYYDINFHGYDSLKIGDIVCLDKLRLAI